MTQSPHDTSCPGYGSPFRYCPQPGCGWREATPPRVYAPPAEPARGTELQVISGPCAGRRFRRTDRHDHYCWEYVHNGERFSWMGVFIAAGIDGLREVDPVEPGGGP